MGQYVNDGKVSIGTKVIDEDDLKAELGALIGVGARADGMIYTSDLGTSPRIAMWAKNKPFIDSRWFFNSDAEQLEARKTSIYGLNADETLHGNNSLVYIVDWARQNLDTADTPKRLRDFDGYNHRAQSGVLLTANPSSHQDDITLATNAETGDNITMRDIFELTSYGSAEQFSWVVIDPFGFIHTIARYTSASAVLNYLFGTGAKTTININDLYTSKNYLSYEQVPAYPDVMAKWYVGLAAKTWTNHRYLISSVSFRGVSYSNTIVRCNGFTPNMTIGTAATGQLKLRQVLYEDYGSIDCCSDDLLFMGCVITNIGTGILSFSKLRVLMLTSMLAPPKAIQLCRYNHQLNSELASGTSAGTGGGLGTAWANGMVYLSLKNLWSAYGGNDFAGFLCLAYVDGNTRIPLTPYISFSLTNTGKTLADINNSLKATLPDVIPVPGWTTTIQ